MRVEALLGFAQNAGCLISGSEAVERALLRGRARLLVIAGDAAPRLRRRVEALAKERGIPVREWGTKSRIGRAIGRPDRGVVAVCENGFARALDKALAGGGSEKG